MTYDEAVREARVRGQSAGQSAATYAEPGDIAPEWLSGEWAGESIPELLGDLMESVSCSTFGEEEALHEALCDAYEEAADEAFYTITR